jgi:hypothetical protein
MGRIEGWPDGQTAFPQGVIPRNFRSGSRLLISETLKTIPKTAYEIQSTIRSFTVETLLPVAEYRRLASRSPEGAGILVPSIHYVRNSGPVNRGDPGRGVSQSYPAH